MNNDKDFANDKVIEVPADGVGKELNIKVGAFDDTFIIRNKCFHLQNTCHWMGNITALRLMIPALP